MSDAHQEKLEKNLQRIPLWKMLQQFFDVKQAEFTNRLETPCKTEMQPVREKWVLIFLFILAFVPRLVMYTLSNGPSDDSYYYIHVANILGDGDFSYRGAFYYLGLNVYPAILLALHSLGFEWLHAGMMWGVVISAMTVLPIYGWVKRLFDYRVAIVASFLFAVHPDLIEYSIELIREPTSWFFVSLFLYLAIRAVTEVKMWLFLCLGVTFCLAVQTRSECWLLLLPLGIWYAHQVISNRVSRTQITLGLIFTVSIMPIILLSVNLTVLKNEEKWQLGRLEYFQTLAKYISPYEDELDNNSVVKTDQKNGLKTVSKTPMKLVSLNVGKSKSADSGNSEQSSSLLFLYLKSLMRTHEPILSVLNLIGVVFFFRQLFHTDKIPLPISYVALLLSVWMRTSYSHNINGRYFHNLFFLTVPFQALGFMVLCNFVAKIRIPKLNHAERDYHAVPVFGLVVLLMAIYWGDAFSSYHIKREEEVLFGQWLHENIDDKKSVLVDKGSTRIGYFAQGSVPNANYHHVLLSDLIAKNPPDLVILSRLKVSNYLLNNTAGLVKPFGLEPIDIPIPHDIAKNYLILTRQPPRSALRIADESNATTVR